MTTTTTLADHPAKFHPTIVAEIHRLLDRWTDPAFDPVEVLDPFAGTGRIHQLAGMGPDVGRYHTTGLELEPEWAHHHPDTVVGDILDMPWGLGSFDAIVTSPCYGNRMADHHQAKDPCKACAGSGCRVDEILLAEGNLVTDGAPWCRGAHPDDGRTHGPCRKCKGKGLSKRYTYRHELGREATEGSATTMAWGTEYRRFHTAAIAAMIGVCTEGGLLVVNVANHPKDGVEQLVTEWWVNAILVAGCSLLEVAHVDTPGNANGAGRWVDGKRGQVIPGEKIIVARTPTPRRLL